MTGFPLYLNESGKLDRAFRLVNRSAAVLCALAVAACGWSYRPVPIDRADGRWETALGSQNRAGYAEETAPRDPAVVWRTEVGDGLLAPLLVDGPFVIAATTGGTVAALSSESGARFWKRSVRGAVHAAPVRRRTRILLATDRRSGRAYALDLRRGVPIWTASVESAAVAPLLAHDAAYIATGDGTVLSLGLDDGSPRWSTRLSGAAAGTPVLLGEDLFVTTRADTIYRIDRRTGELRDRRPLPARVSAPPALHGGTLLVPLFSGVLLALDLPSMEVRCRVSLDASILAAPAIDADGTAYLLSRAARLWRVRADDCTAERIAELGGAARSSLTLVRDGLLVGRLDGTLTLLGTEGRTIWSTDLGDSIAAPVAVRASAIYVPLLRGEVVKLE